MHLLDSIRELGRFYDSCIGSSRFRGRCGVAATYLRYLWRIWRMDRECRGYRRFNRCRVFLLGLLYDGIVKIWQNRLCWTLRRVLRPRRGSCDGPRASPDSRPTRETDAATYARVTRYRAYWAWSLSWVFHGWAAQTPQQSRSPPVLLKTNTYQFSRSINYVSTDWLPANQHVDLLYVLSSTLTIELMAFQISPPRRVGWPTGNYLSLQLLPSTLYKTLWLSSSLEKYITIYHPILVKLL